MPGPLHVEPQWNAAMLRFRFAGQVTVLMAVLGWGIWFFPFDDLLDRSGTPLGGDYVMLYVAGQVVADGDAAKLYDDQLNQQRCNQLFPGLDVNSSWPYRYPPTVAACMSGLSRLPFQWSFLVFFLIQLGLLGFALWRLKSDFAILRDQSGWLWGMAGCPLIIETLIGGQSSLLALACVVGFLHYFQRHHNLLAGVLLALTLYKPNVAAILMVAAIIVRPQLLLGFLPTAVVGLSIALTTSGFEGLLQYTHLGSQLASSQWGLDTPYWKVHGLAPLFQSIDPVHGKLWCGLTGVSTAVTIAWLWRGRRINEFAAVAVLLCCNALFNPYVPIYDLVLLIVALIAACEASRECQHRPLSGWQFQMIVGLLFMGPHLSQALAPTIGVQLFPISLALVLCAGLWRFSYQRRCDQQIAW